jgi:NTE family protein
MAGTDFGLVLAGGGVTGVAWETGLLKGLRDAGLDLTGAQLIVGTSAGSIVGTQIAAGLDLDVLYARQLEAPDPRFERKPSVNFLQELTKLGPELASLGANQPADEPALAQPVRAALGRHASQAATVPEAERIALIAHRLTVSEWPPRRLVVTAVDAEDGSFVKWDQDSGVELVLAVDPLDPAQRSAAAEAGLRQAPRLADDLAAALA